MLEELKKAVCEANLQLVREGLVIQTFGNVSAVDRASGNLVIKPSGVSYDEMKPAHMVVVSLETGKVVEGDLRPSSDTPTHAVLYRAFKGIGGVVHTHSFAATVWAQARREIPALGTTHGDYFYGPVPVTRMLTAKETRDNYELNTGHVIVERFRKLNPLQMPAVLVAHHAPFVWGRTLDEAVHNAVALEFCAKMASETVALSPPGKVMPQALLDKHFLRKHGPGAYYGQSRIRRDS